MSSKKIQLYSLGTPNGQKASVALEEMGIPYDAHRIDIMKGDQFTDEYIQINHNSKIPAIVDPTGDQGRPLAIMESGAILLHLAEQSGQFLSTDSTLRSETIQWLFFQMASVGPMFGQFGHFYKYAGEKCEHPYPTERYATEAKRLLKVLDTRLGSTGFLVGSEMSIADIATAPWVVCLDRFYKAREKLELDSFKNVEAWVGAFMDRPKVQVGMEVCAF